MSKIVTIEELEEVLKVKYPKTFHEIYKSGAMEYLKHTNKWLNKTGKMLHQMKNHFFMRLEETAN